GYFTGSPPDGLVQPPFDVFTPTKYFLLKTDGIGDTDLGNVLPAGLSRDALGADLTVQGSLKPSGGLGIVSLYLVPEPSSVLLLEFGLLGMLGLRRQSFLVCNRVPSAVPVR
ncbi:MAG: PEP-CTERM sorting domain-containing protein, partial [Planctomycetales bacterium]|nr:PEP-CTERM sorting domain-containing protein [Planctomycetales bacterium]